jgi:hypothetical protein
MKRLLLVIISILVLTAGAFAQAVITVAQLNGTGSLRISLC